MKRHHRAKVTEGSGNIFADLGFADPGREQLRASLMLQIYRIIKSRGLTQKQAAAVLGVRQPQVSILMRGQSGNFSAERLMDFLTALGQNVEVTLKPASKKHGEVIVLVA